MTSSGWNYEEFIAFILLYVAHVDMEFSEVEKNLIIDKFGTDTFNKMIKIFESMSDYQAFEKIMEYKGIYYPTVEQKQELIENIKEIIAIDNNINIMEQELLNFLNRMM